MNLLAEIYSQEEMIPNMYKAFKSREADNADLNVVSCDGDDGDENPYMLSTLAPRLWPFMRHSITSVRYSTMRTLVIYLYFAMSRLLGSCTSLVLTYLKFFLQIYTSLLFAGEAA